MVWSLDETKLAYLAERKIPKATPFFTSYSKLGADKNITNDNDAEAKEKAKIAAEGKVSSSGIHQFECWNVS